MLTLPVKCILSLPEKTPGGVACTYPLPPNGLLTTQMPGQVEGLPHEKQKPGQELLGGTMADRGRFPKTLEARSREGSPLQGVAWRRVNISPLISGLTHPAGCRVFANRRPKATPGLMCTQTSAAPVTSLPPDPHCVFALPSPHQLAEQTKAT